MTSVPFDDYQWLTPASLIGLAGLLVSASFAGSHISGIQESKIDPITLLVIGILWSTFFDLCEFLRFEAWEMHWFEFTDEGFRYQQGRKVKLIRYTEKAWLEWAGKHQEGTHDVVQFRSRGHRVAIFANTPGYKELIEHIADLWQTKVP
jgi:hypothetical protein